MRILSRNSGRIDAFVPEWVWEILILVVVTPAMLDGVLRVTHVPIA